MTHLLFGTVGPNRNAWHKDHLHCWSWSPGRNLYNIYIYIYIYLYNIYIYIIYYYIYIYYIYIYYIYIIYIIYIYIYYIYILYYIYIVNIGYPKYIGRTVLKFWHLWSVEGLNVWPEKLSTASGDRIRHLLVHFWPEHPLDLHLVGK